MLYFSPQGVSCFAAFCLFTSRLGTVVFTRMSDGRILRYSSLFVILHHFNFFISLLFQTLEMYFCCNDIIPFPFQMQPAYSSYFLLKYMGMIFHTCTMVLFCCFFHLHNKNWRLDTHNKKHFREKIEEWRNAIHQSCFVFSLGIT